MGALASWGSWHEGNVSLARAEPYPHARRKAQGWAVPSLAASLLGAEQPACALQVLGRAAALSKCCCLIGYQQS